VPGYPTTPVRAAASPSNVTGTTAVLSALGDDDGGEASLTYTWQVVSAPSGVTGSKAPTFSINGTNAAKTTTVTFFAPGSYTFCVGVTDAAGHTTPSHVDVTVTSTLARVDVLPKTPSVKPGGRLHFIALGRDQFNADLGVADKPPYNWGAAGRPAGAGSAGFLRNRHKGPGTNARPFRRPGLEHPPGTVHRRPPELAKPLLGGRPADAPGVLGAPGTLTLP